MKIKSGPKLALPLQQLTCPIHPSSPFPNLPSTRNTTPDSPTHASHHSNRHQVRPVSLSCCSRSPAPMAQPRSTAYQDNPIHPPVLPCPAFTLLACLVWFWFLGQAHGAGRMIPQGTRHTLLVWVAGRKKGKTNQSVKNGCIFWARRRKQASSQASRVASNNTTAKTTKETQRGGSRVEGSKIGGKKKQEEKRKKKKKKSMRRVSLQMPMPCHGPVVKGE